MHKLVLNRTQFSILFLFFFIFERRENGESVTFQCLSSPHRPASLPPNPQRTGRQPGGGLQSEGGRKREGEMTSYEAVRCGEAQKVPFLTFRHRSRNGEMCLKKVVWLITPPPPYITKSTRTHAHTNTGAALSPEETVKVAVL